MRERDFSLLHRAEGGERVAKSARKKQKTKIKTKIRTTAVVANKNTGKRL